MAEPITITVHGQPAPQGSKRAFMGKRKDGTTYQGVIESSHDRVKSWRQAVVDAVTTAAPGVVRRDTPLAVTMVFALRRPKGHYRTGRNAHLLRDAAPRRPTATPDTSKLVRATEDALTDAGIWADDAQVVDIAAAKIYAGDSLEIDGHGVFGLPIPGAVITIREAGR